MPESPDPSTALPDALRAILEESWQRLAAAPADRTSALRTPVLGTAPGEACALRTVVLREVDVAARRLLCYSDRRAGKVAQIAADPRVSWLFYDPGTAVQLRIAGLARTERDGPAVAAAWARTDATARGNYAAVLAPGAPLPADDPRVQLDPGSARANFSVVVCTVEALDWLSLHPSGNRRAHFRWHEGAGTPETPEQGPGGRSGHWSGHWSVP